MKLSSLVALPFLFTIAATSPLPEAHEEVARAAQLTIYGRVTASALKCRTCASTSCTAQRQYAKGATFAIKAQTVGDTIEGNNKWAKTPAGCWVAEAYLELFANV